RGLPVYHSHAAAAVPLEPRLFRPMDEAFEAVCQIRSAGREHLDEILRTAGSLVRIEEDGPALMHDEIEFSIVEAEFTPALTQFVGHRDGLAPDRLRCLDQAVRGDVAGAALSLSAKHPETNSKTVGFSLRNELFHDEIVAIKDAVWNVAERSVDLIGVQDWQMRKRRLFARALGSPVEERLRDSPIVEIAFDDHLTLPAVGFVDQCTTDPPFGYVGGADVEAECKTPGIVDIVRWRHRGIDMQYRHIGADRLRQALLNPNRMAAPFQFRKNVEQHVWAAPAQQNIAPAQEPVMLMRYHGDTRHYPPPGLSVDALKCLGLSNDLY
ncbi:hypothetical protein, partial [Mesorhizobium sp. M7A.F.Ca.US.005.03.2.1]|uniref:hypothetical protein n=1 Tax=Mesorhizobium sp. M7A.F.Ca.US.005.03.2.1 TaxID=2496737 RepID=UPI0019D23319